MHFLHFLSLLVIIFFQGVCVCNVSLMLKKYILQIDLADSCFEVTRQFPLEVEVEVNEEVLLPGTISLSICTISRLCSKVES